MRKNDQEIAIKDLDISVKTKYLLTLLNIYTLADLYLVYILDTIPDIDTVVQYFPTTSMGFIYSKEIDNEVRALLDLHYEEEEILDHVEI